ncbi:MAG: hypothetical protein P1V97_04490 [Planctomycetota bacterium]|nr:hypothetical protein [Planctomycetota bacterium]
MRASHRRGKVTAPTLMAVGAALMLGLVMGLYGAGVFQKRTPNPAPKDASKATKDGTAKNTQNQTSLTNPGAAPSPSKDSPRPSEPSLKPGKPGPALAPTDPNFVPTKDPEPIDAPARDPDVPDMDPEPIKKN